MEPNDVRAIVQQELQKSQYSVAKVPYHVHQGIDSPRVGFHDLTGALFSTSTLTNGTVPVYVFTQANALISATITGAFVVSQGTIAADINIYNNGQTVATITKGTTAGALVGATSLSYSTNATVVTVQSTTAGNAYVFINFAT